MFATLITFVDFSQINLIPCMGFILGCLALVGPWMLAEALFAELETAFWQNRFEDVPFFVLPPEIAALPLEADESKTMHLIGGGVLTPGEPLPIVRAKIVTEKSVKQEVDEMLVRINAMLDMDFQDRFENSLMVWS